DRLDAIAGIDHLAAVDAGLNAIAFERGAGHLQGTTGADGGAGTARAPVGLQGLADANHLAATAVFHEVAADDRQAVGPVTLVADVLGAVGADKHALDFDRITGRRSGSGGRLRCRRPP